MAGRTNEYSIVGDPRIIVQQSGQEFDYQDFTTTNKYGYMTVD